MGSKTYFEKLNEGLIYPSISINIDRYLSNTGWELSEFSTMQKTFYDEKLKPVYSMCIARFRETDWSGFPTVPPSISVTDFHSIQIIRHSDNYKSIERIIKLPTELNEFLELMDSLLELLKEDSNG